MKKYIVAVSMMLICAVRAQGEETAGAKAIFFEEGGAALHTSAAKKSTQKKGTVASRKKEAPVSAGNYLGISYWVDLVDSTGKASRTTASRVFHSGDRIKLNVMTNRAGYLYVLGIGSSGSSRVLFPNSPDVANGIKAKVAYAVPFGGAMKFDTTPGEEQLLIVLSEQPLDQFSGQKVLPAQATNQLIAVNSTGSKDLLLEDDVATPGAAPASYAVIPTSAAGASAPLTVLVKLKHE